MFTDYLIIAIWLLVMSNVLNPVGGVLLFAGMLYVYYRFVRRVSYMGMQHTPQSDVICERVRQMADKLGDIAVFRYSARSTPHILVRLPNWQHEFSIVFFNSSNTWRIFYPFGASVQRKKNVYSDDEVLALFTDLRTKDGDIKND